MLMLLMMPMLLRYAMLSLCAACPLMIDFSLRCLRCFAAAAICLRLRLPAITMRRRLQIDYFDVADMRPLLLFMLPATVRYDVSMLSPVDADVLSLRHCRQRGSRACSAAYYQRAGIIR